MLFFAAIQESKVMRDLPWLESAQSSLKALPNLLVLTKAVQSQAVQKQALVLNHLNHNPLFTSNHDTMR